MIASDLKDYRSLLLARRRDLTATDDEKRSTRPVELDQSRVGRLSRMDALQSQAMAKATAGRRRVELSRIDAALRRLEEDEFGYCVSCGDPIALERLELDPAVPTCIKCAG